MGDAADRRRPVPEPETRPGHLLGRLRLGGDRPYRQRSWLLPAGRTLSDDLWHERHLGLCILAWAQVPVLLVLGHLRGIDADTLVVELCIVALPAAVALLPRLGRNVRAAGTALSMVTGASVLVHISGGAIVAHFQFFVVIALLTLYQSWQPFLVTIVYVLVEHGVIATIAPRLVYDDPDAIAHPWRFALLHTFFVLTAGGANLLAWRLSEQEALFDSLTKLPNRVLFLDVLDRLLRERPHATGVVFIDLDNFKDANDGYGHDAGDQLLVDLAERLHAVMRSRDLLARLGGDEFAVVVSGAGLPAAQELGDRISRALGRPFSVAGANLRVGASIGVAWGADGLTAAELLRNADLAMYASKRAGRGVQSAYTPALHQAAMNRAELDSAMRAALEQREFTVHYQPIVDLRSGVVCGLEALARWQDPLRGTVAPADFIPAAERSGLVVELGAQVLRQACREAAWWQGSHRGDIRVSVNLSPRQLADPTLVGTVVDALERSGLDAHLLCLEITETSLIEDFEETMATLLALRATGAGLSLDDFGTGYSSLGYLRRLPVDNIKVDRSFVADVALDEETARIVLAIVDLARALGRSVTAEGVEDEHQLRHLGALGIEHAQGFLLGRPVRGHDIWAEVERAERRAAELLGLSPPLVLGGLAD